ncbi:glycoside hydrolase family 76 protein [Podospora appendiculata]|uniref:Mannan endo-1,6-alpha-mannosidase n=1 Tax=Podospora appendiculata TaxID=314037 RepID=A0AAE0X5D1_9PEZI|nr:glycoside hydrolase family 76 protein [Podospora appendiculata]
MRGIFKAVAAVCLLAQSTTAIDLTLGDPASVKSAASTIAYGLVKYYTGNNTGDTPGNLPDPYFWWEAGAMFGTLIDYWFLTGDTTYNEITTQAMLHQAAPTADFMPQNQTRTLGNDDQGFWAMAAMSAAENNYPNPPADQPQWLAIVQAVFNQYASRWDEATCGGGLRWQIFTFNNGFNYKNSISNGCFFNIAARLARFTGNQTYADWADKIYNWEVSAGLILPNGDIYDGVGIKNTNDCSSTDQIQWSYNHGIFLHGSAVMYNLKKNTSDTSAVSLWQSRVDTILKSTTELFFNNTIMVEQFCEEPGFCDNDQRSFKGYLTRWLSGTAQMAPYTFDTISPLLKSDAVAAAKACTGDPATGFKGMPGTACGFKWTAGGFDGMVGVGEQMNALDAVMYTLADRVATPVTAETGGTSAGNPSAGVSSSMPYKQLAEIKLGDRVAAGFLTSAFVFSVMGGCAFVMI